ncbi:hypothetical protein ACFVH4_30140 [Nocardia ignorata]|uniref:hypothetical protein n=1 Tax=Nocardia ignorata TaxID=145285 RepID=UPI00362C3131
MITFGFIVAVGLPLAVIVGVVLWPERIPPDRTVSAIQQRIARESASRLRRRGPSSGPPR